MITYNEVIGIHNNNINNDESIIKDEKKSCGNVDMDSDCSQKGKPDEADKDPDQYVLNSQNSSDDDDKTLTLPPPVAKKATKKKRLQQQNQILQEVLHVLTHMMLGQPPTMAELDAGNLGTDTFSIDS